MCPAAYCGGALRRQRQVVGEERGAPCGSTMRGTYTRRQAAANWRTSWPRPRLSLSGSPLRPPASAPRWADDVIWGTGTESKCICLPTFSRWWQHWRSASPGHHHLHTGAVLHTLRPEFREIGGGAGAWWHRGWKNADRVPGRHAPRRQHQVVGNQVGTATRATATLRRFRARGRRVSPHDLLERVHACIGDPDPNTDPVFYYYPDPDLYMHIFLSIKTLCKFFPCVIHIQL